MKVEDRRSVELRERARGLERRRIGRIVLAVVALLGAALSGGRANLLTRPVEYRQWIAQIDGMLQSLASMPSLGGSDPKSTRERFEESRRAWTEAAAAYPWYLAGWIGCAAVWGVVLALWVASERGIARKQRRYRWLADGRCGGCGYSLQGLADGRCPECGDANTWADAQIEIPPD